MSIRKCFAWQGTAVVSTLLLAVTQPLAAETSSESKRIQELERAVAELKQEVNRLKKQAVSAPEGKMKTKVTYDGKTYVEKAVAEEEKPPVLVVPRASEFKLVLGGYIQVNFEDGDVSAFEGRFGMTALKDRFRLRRARINLTGDFAENFDFKIEGDFENSDGIQEPVRLVVNLGDDTRARRFPVVSFVLPAEGDRLAGGKLLREPEHAAVAADQQRLGDLFDGDTAAAVPGCLDGHAKADAVTLPKAFGTHSLSSPGGDLKDEINTPCRAAWSTPLASCRSH